MKPADPFKMCLLSWSIDEKREKAGGNPKEHFLGIFKSFKSQGKRNTPWPSRNTLNHEPED